MRPAPWAALLPVLLATEAQALPRFAARTGADCALCHVSPGGGGMRNRYGANVFQALELSLQLSEEPLAPPMPTELSDWLSFGADVRAAYLHVSPQRAVIAGEEPEHTSSFFLMQADLYTAARLGPHLTVVLDAGAYSGFEAWMLLALASGPSSYDLQLKLGRFVPSFGLRDANHDLYTRCGVGLGPIDRDTGLELYALAGPLSASLSLVNGTYGDEVLDRHGSADRSFEKALVGRVLARFGPEWLHVQVSGSVYWNDNVDSTNPLFADRAAGTAAMAGVDELRAGAALLLGLGPLSYQGELIYVRDRLAGGPPARLSGYASAQELAMAVLPGLEIIATLEFMDPDLDLIGDTALRAGLAAELFPLPSFELRVMARRAFQDHTVIGDVTDVLVFAHAAF